ncbi:hypothetical protein Hlac_0077 [Halorubrum lacusprofundi ATCC 49239]|jgi:hypothetical protein|uniref:Uncharacterized protein n=1 Tax=Halorubrum lacusprofundi (strain ATCC 49239 / DSM 5036 / JCM 8891 / ACAM 34) TaxID=416348 RepID=B9LQT1_HALLT|nr:hypothetical protein Hlac_0077 [Halorubrum lacusprofundi ATCC 49239]
MTLPVDTPRQRHRHVPAAPMTTVHDSIAALVEQEGWRAEGDAARVHYDGGGDRFAVEFYANAERVLYWTVPSAESDATAATAAPVPREQVPDPLRRRIREDLDAAGVDPDVERREV